MGSWRPCMRARARDGVFSCAVAAAQAGCARRVAHLGHNTLIPVLRAVHGRPDPAVAATSTRVTTICLPHTTPGAVSDFRSTQPNPALGHHPPLRIHTTRISRASFFKLTSVWVVPPPPPHPDCARRVHTAVQRRMALNAHYNTRGWGRPASQRSRSAQLGLKAPCCAVPRGRRDTLQAGTALLFSLGSQLGGAQPSTAAHAATVLHEVVMPAAPAASAADDGFEMREPPTRITATGRIVASEPVPKQAPKRWMRARGRQPHAPAHVRFACAAAIHRFYARGPRSCRAAAGPGVHPACAHALQAAARPNTPPLPPRHAPFVAALSRPPARPAAPARSTLPRASNLAPLLPPFAF